MIPNPLRAFRAWVTEVVRLGDFIPGQTYTPLDGLVQLHSTSAVETYFSQSDGAKAIGRSFSSFLDDPEGTLALKKSYLAQFENRARILALRLDAPENYGFGPVDVPTGTHPIDHFVNEYLSGIANTQIIKTPSRRTLWDLLRLVTAALTYTFAFVLRSIYLLLFQSGQPNPITCFLAAPDIAPVSDFQVIDDALADRQPIDPAEIRVVIIRERGLLNKDAAARIPVLDPDKTRLPFKYSLLEIFVPGLLMCSRVCITAILNYRDSRTAVLALMAIHQAIAVLKIQQVAHTVRCRYYLDWVEYNELHILRDIVLRKYGGGVVRWPHSSLYAPGVFTSYLGYSLFLSNGPFPAENFGDTWSSRTISKNVGYLQFDTRYQAGNRVDLQYRKAIEAAIADGKRVIAYFCSSDVGGLPSIETEALNALWAALHQSKNWYLVIKPKSYNKQHIYKLMRSDSRLEAIFASENVLLIDYPADGDQVCSSGWLVEKMYMGSGLLGSISAEAFTRQKIFFSYYPVFDQTQHSQRLIDLGFLHTNPKALETAVVSALETPPLTVYDPWYFDNFDPFRDNNALTRVTTILNDQCEQVTVSDKTEKRSI